MRKKRRSANENLIPFEKSRKVIRLERRRLERKMSPGALITALLATACILYCLTIYFFMGYGSRFFLIWGVLAIGFGLWSYLLWQAELLEKIPTLIRKIFRGCVLIGVLLFLVVEGMVFSQFGATANANADYVIILGAQWKNHGPSYVLQKRLDKAVTYLKENPDTFVIVSGGQGYNEPMTEARGMAGYLKSAGIEEYRIIQEDTSTNTNENLSFSSTFLNKETDSVVIVTNNFHMFRALKIARGQGYAKAEGLAAGSYPAMLPNNLLREFFGVIKDFVAGNM